jgi:2-keto-4-pentenoate hydratase/2-oxohepta-3-ene-1,7-dioic acid hydratase in catechol pathway
VADAAWLDHVFLISRKAVRICLCAKVLDKAGGFSEFAPFYDQGAEGAIDMAGYKLATYQSADGPRAGLVVDDKVFDAARLAKRPDYATVLGILQDWRAARGILSKAAAKPGKTVSQPIGRTKLLAPVLWPSAIFCAGANYQDHANEMAAKDNRPPPPDPHTLGLESWHFIKASRSIAHPGQTIKISTYSQKMDWEVELAAVIGRAAKDVPVERALDYVAGYTVANDLSARDRGRRPHVPDTSPFKADWVAHKSFDGSCPLGPWIVPASEIKDPQKLAIKLWVNDVIKQDSNTSEMIFNLAEQISHLSSRLTLHPGDLILTGTPAGVGAGRGEFLKAGDVVKLWIENVGEITNKMA